MLLAAFAWRYLSLLDQFGTLWINFFMTEVSIIKKPVHWWQSKSVDWFLCDRDLRHEGVKRLCFLRSRIYLTLCEAYLSVYFNRSEESNLYMLWIWDWPRRYRDKWWWSRNWCLLYKPNNDFWWSKLEKKKSVTTQLQL